MFLLKPLLSRLADGPGRLSPAQLCGHILYEEEEEAAAVAGGSIREAARKRLQGEETQAVCVNEAAKDWGSRQPGRRRDLICLKGSSDSYAI